MKLSPESPVAFLEPLSWPPERVFAAEITTPFGPLVMAGEGEALLAARMNTTFDRFVHELRSDWDADVRIDSGPFREVIERFHEYFAGTPGPVHAVVRPLLTPSFIHSVHRLLARIPYGRTVTYGELAGLAGSPRAARAVGGACGKNPVLIVVPCHRVLASHGLGGFGAGLDEGSPNYAVHNLGCLLKERLLRLEAAG